MNRFIESYFKSAITKANTIPVLIEYILRLK